MGYVSVVGDADQAIFEWRDAVPDYIVNCSQYLDSLNTYQLTINYRSPANIVNLSQNLIANNKVSYERQRVVPANSSTAHVEIIKGEDVREISRLENLCSHALSYLFSRDESRTVLSMIASF